METDVIEVSHNDLALLLFALQGGKSAAMPDTSSCEEACPVVESVEELLCGGQLDPREQLVRHLNNHIREALIECGMFEMMAAGGFDPSRQISAEESVKLDEINRRLASWTCEIKLASADRSLLRESLLKLPRASRLMMPRTMWRLKKKLKGESHRSDE
jgi:hypothetical protein